MNLKKSNTNLNNSNIIQNNNIQNSNVLQNSMNIRNSNNSNINQSNLQQSNIVRNSMNIPNSNTEINNEQQSNIVDDNTNNLENLNMIPNSNTLNQEQPFKSYIVPQNYNMQNANYDFIFNNVNIVKSQRPPIFNRPIINQSTSKTIVQEEKTLPMKYLPEVVKEIIVDENVKTLPIIMSQKNVTFGENQDNTNNDISQENQYNPTTISYQDQSDSNQQFQYEF